MKRFLGRCVGSWRTLADSLTTDSLAAPHGLQHFPTVVQSLNYVDLPLLIYTPNGQSYSGPDQIQGFLQSLPAEVERLVDQTKKEALCRDVERKIGDLELGAIETDVNKVGTLGFGSFWVARFG